MKVLVTGGAGFIGSHIVDQLVEKGDQVVIVDNISSGRKENINEKARFYQIDITDSDLLNVFERERPEAVIHQAAQIHVHTSVKEPMFDATVNILGTINLLEACRKTGVKKVVYASSAAIYGNPEYLPIDEKHPVAPLSGYGVSKYTPEHYFAIYRQLYGLNYTILRYANVYGLRQDPRGEGGVISILVDKYLRRESFTVFGDGEQTRDYIYVGDVARANIMALSQGDGEVFNVGTGVSTSLNEVVKRFNEIAGYENKVEYGPEREGDIKHSYFNNGKIRRVLGWQPEVTLEEGLRKTYEYYQDIYRKMDKEM
ncbi:MULTISPECIES: SDR family oxidoreductase [Thermoactinomyces]|jgi:UDP-glucose 4-epimerase|uniref:SDR family oxidoreductase n=1 Tax=Thermoactinomyces daqus TaxID=1329516 RepID=A0A7W2AHK1_9BACL|nr:MULTISPECIES: SDR family oxidoreductase [Thermoactinomyces]MBA4541799.1 SDR family oxidoreductase [Thermoactinomyces daqus]MBH8597797.1 SDR family oxidoreductase [Thermoactinomyces sp. CICC 10523]MBH8604148.1 SDR family oxidoreductase [Thermoactinomyces sp. CICC 10522]MBH8608639.1 SDR family oxidoreductase [Thermoactinomyces sp. CICC 10521]